MSPVLSRLLGREARGARRLPAVAGTRTSSSVAVAADERALQISAVYACVSLLAETIANLPVGVHRRDGKKRVALDNDPVHRLVSYAPNPTMDAGEFWSAVVGWMLLRGNAYVFIERTGSGRIVNLWPISPASVEPKRTESGPLAYTVTLAADEYVPGFTPGTAKAVPATKMLHYRAFGLGPVGLSPISVAREQIGTGYAALNYVGGFFARDASPGGVLSVDGALTEAQYERLTRQWSSLHEGFDKAHQLAVLEGGAKWQNTTLSPADAQFLATYRLTRQEIASIFHVPPHKIGEMEHSTFSNIEHQGTEYVQDGLLPIIGRLERTTRRGLLLPDQYVRFNASALMRGDTAARTASYVAGRQWGWLSANDVLAKEDQDPIEGGDEYLVPLNMHPVGEPRHAPAPAPAPPREDDPGDPNPEEEEDDPGTPDASRVGARTVRALPLVETASTYVERIHTTLTAEFARERAEVLALGEQQRGVADGLSGLAQTWVERLVAGLEEHVRDLTVEEAGQIAAALAGEVFYPGRVVNFVRAVLRRRAENITETTVRQIIDAARDAQDGAAWPDVVETVLPAEGAERTTLLAAALVGTFGTIGRQEGAEVGGAARKTWRVTSTNPRPEHQALDGETVGVRDRFSNGAQYPHDPALDAAGVSNCQCVIEYETE